MGRDGLIRPAAVEQAITSRTVLISLLWANNEIGVIQPVSEIAAWRENTGVFFHVDGVQAAGKIPLDVEASCIDLLSLSAHKLYGPKAPERCM